VQADASARVRTTVRHSVMVVHGRKSKNAWSQNALAGEQGGELRSLRSLTASSKAATARIMAAAASLQQRTGAFRRQYIGLQPAKRK
jgi:hypothetical protein